MRFSFKEILKTALKSRWRYIIGAAMVLALLWLFFGRGNGGSGAVLAIIPGDFIEQVSVSGTVTAAENADLGFAANGRISGTYAVVGEHVWTGTIIAQMENSDLVAALEQKQATLAQAEAGLAEVQAGTRSEEIAIAESSVTSAKSSLISSIQSAFTTSDDAIHNRADTIFTNPRTDPILTVSITNSVLKNDLENERETLEQKLADWALLISHISNSSIAVDAKKSGQYLDAVSSFLADANAALNYGVSGQTTTAATISSYTTTIATARTNVNTVETNLSAAVASLDSAEKNLALKRAGSTGDSIAAAAAVAAAARADVENARATLAKTRITAPFSGIVTRMDAKVGEVVSPSVSLISMQSDGIFQIETYIPEIVIAKVATGNPATTTLDAYGSMILFPAKVVSVDPAETVKDGVPTYKTTLSFLSVDSRIRSGMTTNITIETGVLHNAIVIPSGAVGTKNSSSYVSAIVGGTVENRIVTTGSSPALGQIEILSGLSAGDTVLLTPAS